MKFVICLVLLCCSLRFISGSQITERRLRNELRFVNKSELVKNNVYSVKLVDGSMYDWMVELRSIDANSELYQDLQVLNEKEGTNSILLNIKFMKTFPFEAPAVRVVYPVIESDDVTSSGNVRLNMLSDDGWTPVYTAEAIILQTAETLIQGGARVRFGYQYE